MIKRETWFVPGRKRENLKHLLENCSDSVQWAEAGDSAFHIQSDGSADDIGRTIPRRMKIAGYTTSASLFFEGLKKNNRTCTFVESCTGGWCAQQLTDFPGSSAHFWGGWVVYSNDAKIRLGVPEEVLEAHGAVSRECVVHLAQSGARVSGASLAISISGIAGPDGGSEGKPVGTVWIGVQQGSDRTIARLFRFSGNRRAVRDKACTAAFLMGRNCLDIE